MSPSVIASPADPAQETRTNRLPGLGVVATFFAAGLAIGTGLAADQGDEFLAGLVILLCLSVAVALLERLAQKSRLRVTAGEASYRAFFDHAVEGIFRTTPQGHYLAVNQALCDIYGYPSP